MIKTEGFSFPPATSAIISGVLQQQRLASKRDRNIYIYVCRLPLVHAGARVVGGQQTARRGNEVATRERQSFRTREHGVRKGFARAARRGDGLGKLLVYVYIYIYIYICIFVYLYMYVKAGDQVATLTRARRAHSLIYTPEGRARGKVIFTPQRWVFMERKGVGEVAEGVASPQHRPGREKWTCGSVGFCWWERFSTAAKRRLATAAITHPCMHACKHGRGRGRAGKKEGSMYHSGM